MGSADPNAYNQGELMARLRGESFIGGQLTGDETAGLDRLRTQAQTAGLRSGDTTEAIARRRAALDTAGQTPADLGNIQKLLESEYAHSRDISPDVADVLRRRKEGLGGLTSQENTALLESLMGDTQRGFGGALSAAAGNQAASGLSGGVGNAQLQQLLHDYTAQQFGARQNVALANVDIQNQRLGSYEDLANLIDSNQYGRAQETLGSYGNFSTALDQLKFNRGKEALDLFETSARTAESDEFARGSQANAQYATAASTLGENSRADRFNRLKNYQDELYRQRTDNFNRVLSNVNTLSSEVSARTGVALGVPQFLQSVRTSRDTNAIAREGINVAGGGNSGSGGGGSSSGSGTAQQQTSSGSGFLSSQQMNLNQGTSGI